MNKQDDSDAVLRNYLLGLLPEAETERLDELSVTEEVFTQNLRIAEHDLIDAYVNGELTGKELLEFSKQYGGTPLRRDRVRFAQAFQAAIQTRAVVERPKTDEETGDTSKTAVVSFLSFKNWSPLKWGFVASSLLLFLVASWFFVRQLGPHSQQTPPPATSAATNAEPPAGNSPGPSPNAPTGPTSESPKTGQERLAQRSNPPANPAGPARVVAFVLRPQMRSEQIAELVIPSDTTTVALMLLLGPIDTNYHRAILTEASSDRTVWQSGKVKVTTIDEMSVLQLRLPAALLRQEVYRIRAVGIYPNGTTETTNEYSFHVVK